MSLYINVPYNEKEDAKKMGALWNPRARKWYIESKPENYIKFSKWILGNNDEADIYTDAVFLIEGSSVCWKCGNNTRVVGLGVSKFCRLYDFDGECNLLIMSDDDNELHLAWASNEKDVPPKILSILKERYSVKTVYSQTRKRPLFSNCCECCGALQGNWFLFDEPKSPLSSCAHGCDLGERLSRLKIWKIPLEDDLQLNWDVVTCSTDYAYFKFAECEPLICSSEPEKYFASFEDLYCNYVANNQIEIDKFFN